MKLDDHYLNDLSGDVCDEVLEIAASKCTNEIFNYGDRSPLSPNIRSPGGRFDQLARDESARNEEEKGVIEFHVINNDLSSNQEPNKLLWLLQLQNVFAMQLPRMPREYIVRLVFDTKHKNLVLVKAGQVSENNFFYIFKAGKFTYFTF